MRNKLYKQATAVATTLLLSLFLLPACSDESGGNTPEIPETKYAKLTVTLGSLDNAEPATRAADDNNIIDDNFADEAYERHIDDWYIIVVKSNGTVDRVVSNNKEVTTTELSDTDANNNHEDSETTIGMELVIGETYSFYALANIKGLANSQAVIAALNGLKGQSFSTFRKTEATLKALTGYTGSDNTAYIPMSSYVGSKTVTDNIDANKVSLQLIRLLGKVSVEVTNATGVDITVNKLTMGKFRQSGNIYLLPYDAVEKDPADGKGNLLIGTGADNKLMDPDFPDGPATTGSDWAYTPATGATDQVIEKADADNENANKQAYMFYINETDQASVDANGGDMKIALDISGEGLERNNEPKPTNFFFIRRNDLLKIPVLISNATTTIGFEQKHMPIGGLPVQYKFTSGAEVSARTFVTDHAGEITITYSLDEMNGSDINGTDPQWELKYYTNGTSVTKGERFCHAALTANTEVANGTGYLLEPAAKDELLWWKAAFGNETNKPACAFPLVKAKADNGTDDSPGKGSFTITLQELAGAASATIRLTLVAVHKTNRTEVVLPYTLTIKNKEGGN